MIGQDKLLNKLLSYNIDNFPKSLILVGEEGSGKHSICEIIRNKMELELSESFDDLVKPSQIIIDFNNLKDKDIQSLLKTIEEPQPNIFIVILCESLISVPDTIKNRCQIEILDNYSKEILVNITNIKDDLVLTYCNTPGLIYKYCNDNINEIVSLCNTMLDKISVANVANTLSISSKIKFKQDDIGIDFKLFTLILINCLVNKIKTNSDNKYMKAYNLTDKFVNDAHIINIDKKKLLENYLLSLKSIMQC